MFFVVPHDSLGQRLFAVFQHFNHEFEFLIQLGDRVLLFLLKLLLNLLNVFLEHLSLLDADLNLVFESDLLSDDRVDLVLFLLNLVADLVSFVLAGDALGADVSLAGFTHVLGLLLGMQQTKLVDEVFSLFRALLSSLAGGGVAMYRRDDTSERVSVSFIVDVVQDGEVADQVFDFWREDLTAGWTSEDVAGPQVEQAALAESVPAQ